MSEENNQVDKVLTALVSVNNDADKKEEKEEKNDSENKEKKGEHTENNTKEFYMLCIRKPCTSIRATREHIRGLIGCCKSCQPEFEGQIFSAKHMIFDKFCLKNYLQKFFDA